MNRIALIILIVVVIILMFVSRPHGYTVDYTCPDPLILQCYNSGGIPITKNCKLVQCLRRNTNGNMYSARQNGTDSLEAY